MRDERTRIAVVGASGAVGREALALLLSMGVTPGRIGAFASGRSAGSTIACAGVAFRVGAVDPARLAEHDVALFCADAETARRHAPPLAGAGTLVVDNSSAFRMDPDVPLVIPEVNGSALDRRPRLVANPNCSTVILLTALEPIRRAFGIERISLSTYQAVSGAGRAGIRELRAQTRAVLDGGTGEPTFFPEPCAFNVFPHESGVDPDTGFNEEERKIVAESRRIWGLPDLPILPTCVRVPVERAHSQSVAVDLAGPATRADVEDALRAAAGVALFGDPRGPTPLRAAGGDDVLVGRVRLDPDGSGRRLLLWICGDQLRKGAALNAIQIAAACRAGPSGRPQGVERGSTRTPSRS